MRSIAKRIVALAWALLILTAGIPVLAADEGNATLESQGEGLQTATFNTFNGTVTVNLPEDVVAGDTFSGTVVAEPSGDSEKKKDKNRTTLVGYVFELGEHPRGEVGAGRLTLDVPERRDDGSIPTTATLILREVRKGKPGREVGRVEIPVRETAHPIPDFRLPSIAQQNVPLRVPGPFDGDLSSSVLRVGGVDATPLAESPRGAIFRSPHTVSGVAPVTLHEKGERVAEGKLRNVGTNLSAPKSDLAAGESTTLTTRVTGLEDLDEEIPLRLRFWPPAIISVQGGYEHDKTIRPEDVAPDGTYSFGVQVTGRIPGGWGASVRVKLPEPSVIDHYVLVLSERPVGRIEPVGGIPETGATGFAFQTGLNMSKPFYEWVRASFDQSAQPREGRIVGADAAGRSVEATDFKAAMLDEVTFPRLDVEDQSPAMMTFTLKAESIRHEKTPGHKKLDTDGLVGSKTWLCSNFRFEIGGLPVDSVSKVELPSWTQKIQEHRVGSRRQSDAVPAPVETPDLKLHVSSADLSTWERWHRAFFIIDRSSPDAPGARLVFLDTDQTTELAALEFHEVTASSMQVDRGADSTEEAREVSIDLSANRLNLQR